VILRHHNELERMSDTALFFGCGPSINDITVNDWNILKQYDTWAVNFFIYHDFIIPNFYYRSCGKYGSQDEFFHKFREIWNEKRKGSYENTKFITNLNSKKCISNLDADEVYLVASYESWKSALRIMNPKRGRYSFSEFEEKVHQVMLSDFKIMKDKVYFYGRASLCLLLVLMYQMGYKEIILYGNDLKSKDYFWSDRPKSTIHWQWAKQTKSSKASKKAGPHPNIISIKTFVPWFNENYMNNRIFVGSRRTLLYDDVPYKAIEEFK
jgi:hypothetical protein